MDLLSRILAQPPPVRRKQLRKTRADEVSRTRQLLKTTVYSLTKEYRQRAWMLVEEIDKRKMMFSPNGEFIPHGTTDPITGSDVREIIHYILMKAHERPDEPKGFLEFLTQVMDSPPPQMEQ